MGGPVIRDRAFVFGAYEGYRESASRRVNGTVPTVSYRNEILRALPFAETKVLLDVLPLPNVPVNDDLGRFEGIRNATSRENHVLLKGDLRVTPTSNFGVTYTRMRPFGLDPSYYITSTAPTTGHTTTYRIASPVTSPPAAPPGPPKAASAGTSTTWAGWTSSS